MTETTPAPFEFRLEYPESLSRLHLLLKTFLGWIYVGIPHGIILYIYGILVGITTLVSFVVILITAQYPRGLFNFAVGYYRWNNRVSAYLALLTDQYPPFETDLEASDLYFDVAYPDRLSRVHAALKFFLGWLYVGIPHGIILLFYAVAVFFTTIAAWFAILITGRYPRGLFNFAVGYLRWNTRMSVYLALLRDEYPPFHGRE